MQKKRVYRKNQKRGGGQKIVQGAKEEKSNEGERLLEGVEWEGERETSG